MRLSRTLLCALLACLLVAAPAAAAPVQGRTATALDGKLVSGDGAVLHDRADGWFVAARSTDGAFAVELERRGGRTIGVGVRANASDRVVWSLGATAWMLNGSEWAPSRDTTYLFPTGGSIHIPLLETAIVVTSAAGDRVEFERLDLDEGVRVTAAAGREDGELDGLLGTFDADGAGTGDFGPRDAELAAWRRDLADAMFSVLPADLLEAGCAYGGGAGGVTVWPFTLAQPGIVRTSDADVVAGGELLVGGASSTAEAGACRGYRRTGGERVVAVAMAPASLAAAGLPASLTVVRLLHVDIDHDVVRYATLLRNSGPGDITVPVTQRFAAPGGAPLDVLASSSGDAVASSADDWAVVQKQGTAKPSTFVWSGSDARRTRGAARVGDGNATTFTSGGTSLVIDFGAVAVPAGRTTTLLVVQRPGGATVDGELLAADPFGTRLTPEAHDGMLTFFAPGADPDLDGVAVVADNCATTENPGQADADGDAAGDACDADDDGDGLTDGVELEGGTDPLKADTDGDGLDDRAERSGLTSPLKADTDGDGRVDGQDACPLLPGDAEDGCFRVPDLAATLPKLVFAAAAPPAPVVQPPPAAQPRPVVKPKPKPRPKPRCSRKPRPKGCPKPRRKPRRG